LLVLPQRGLLLRLRAEAASVSEYYSGDAFCGQGILAYPYYIGHCHAYCKGRL